MTIIAFHNTKGGVGSTTLAAHMCALAKSFGLRVAGLAYDRTQDLAKWLHPLAIPCLNGLTDSEPPSDLDLIIADIAASAELPALPVDLTVVPINCPLSIHHASNLSDRLMGRVAWLENRVQVPLSAIELPSHLVNTHLLTGRRGVPASRAIACAAHDRRIVWEDDNQSAGARALRAAMAELLILAGAVTPPVAGPTEDEA